MSLNFKKTLEILLSDEIELFKLAELSGLEPLTFYQGADLRGLNLEGQNLSGLNFDRADLRSATMDRVKYDEGAFNNSLLNTDAVSVDDYDISFVELLAIMQLDSRNWFLVEFRPSSLELALSYSRLPYYEVARRAQLNQGTLRKARRGEPVTRVSAESIVKVISSAAQEDVELVPLFERTPQRGDSSWTRQPAVKLVEASTAGGVQPLWAPVKEILLKHALAVYKASKIV